MGASLDRFHTLFPVGMERVMEHGRFYLRVILTVIKRELQGVELTLRNLCNYPHLSRNMCQVKYIQGFLVSPALCSLL